MWSSDIQDLMSSLDFILAILQNYGSFSSPIDSPYHSVKAVWEVVIKSLRDWNFHFRGGQQWDRKRQNFKRNLFQSIFEIESELRPLLNHPDAEITRSTNKPQPLDRLLSTGNRDVSLYPQQSHSHQLFFFHPPVGQMLVTTDISYLIYFVSHSVALRAKVNRS